MTHHPHVHMIVPGGALSEDGSRWIAARPGFLVHFNVLSGLLRRKFLERGTDGLLGVDAIAETYWRAAPPAALRMGSGD
jgi:Putative transposase